MTKYISFLAALFALFLSACEANDVPHELSADVPLRFDASVATSTVMTRAGGDATILEGGTISLRINDNTKYFTFAEGGVMVPEESGEPFTVTTATHEIFVEAYGTMLVEDDDFSGPLPVVTVSNYIEIVWNGDVPTATIAFRIGSTRMTVEVYDTDGTTRLPSFRISGEALYTHSFDGEKYLFGPDKKGVYTPAEPLIEGTPTLLRPFGMEAGAILFSMEDSNASGEFAGKTYIVPNTSGDDFHADAGRHYLVTVTLRDAADPIVFISDMTASWTMEPVQEIPSMEGYDMLIYTEADLNSFCGRVNKGESNLRALQMGTLNLSGSWTPIGTIDKMFSGVYNGNGYTINNLFMDTNRDDAALFGVIGPGAILTGIRIKNADVTNDKQRAAILVSRSLGSDDAPVVISLCEVSGRVKAPDSAGGLVAFARNSYISRTHATAELTCTGSSATAGGLIGTLYYSSLLACTADTKITAPNTARGDCIGGLVGNIDLEGADVSFCYSLGTIASAATLNSAVGGLIGKLSAGTVTRSYSSVRLAPKTGTASTLFYGAIIGSITSNGTLSFSNANLGASGTTKIVGDNIGTVENNCTSTLADRAATVGATLTGSTGGIVYPYTTVWNTDGYGVSPLKKIFYPRKVWINAQSPTIDYTYNGDFTIG